MKKIFAALLLFTLAAALVGCDSHPVAPIPTDTDNNPTETGYPTGQVQQEMIMYNGHVFIHDNNGFDHPLPEGFRLVGKVQHVDNESIPDEDFAACHLDEGQEIYADPTVVDIIYVRYSGGYGVFKAETTANVTASVKDVTRTGLTLVLTGPGKPCDFEITTGSQFILEKYVDGKWEKMDTLVPEDEIAWTAIAYLIPCNDDPEISDHVEIETHWPYIYGTLTDGKYRVVKSISEFHGMDDIFAYKVYAEFAVDSSVK